MAYQSPITNNAKTIVVLLIGVVLGMAIITAFDMPHDQVCRVIPDYSEKAYTDSHIYDSDPQKQLDVFRQELGDSWASGHYDAENDTLHVCSFKESGVLNLFQ